MSRSLPAQWLRVRPTLLALFRAERAGYGFRQSFYSALERCVESWRWTADLGSRRMQARYPPTRAKRISPSINRSPFPLLPQSRGAAEAAPTQAPPLRPVAQLQECKRPKATRLVAPESKHLGILRARLRWQRLGLN